MPREPTVWHWHWQFRTGSCLFNTALPNSLTSPMPRLNRKGDDSESQAREGQTTRRRTGQPCLPRHTAPYHVPGPPGTWYAVVPVGATRHYSVVDNGRREMGMVRPGSRTSFSPQHAGHGLASPRTCGVNRDQTQLRADVWPSFSDSKPDWAISLHGWLWETCWAKSLGTGTTGTTLRRPGAQCTRVTGEEERYAATLEGNRS